MGFNTPPVTKNLIIINILFFLATYVLSGQNIDLNYDLGLHFLLSPDFRLYQPITYMFLHGGFTHILFNMFALWMFGRIVEYEWGPKRFLIFYMVCGIGAGLTQELVTGIHYLIQTNAVPTELVDLVLRDGAGVLKQNMNYSDNTLATLNETINGTTVGASGAIFGILLAFGMMHPNDPLFIFPLPMPIKAKWLVIGYAVIELVLGISSPASTVAHFAHLGGMLFGWILIMMWRKQRHPFAGFSSNGGRSPWGEDNWYASNTDSTYRPKKKNIFERWKDKIKERRKPKMKFHYGERIDDYKYNLRKKEQQEEIDRILEKVSRKGYNSLTDEEKKKLFDAGQK